MSGIAREFHFNLSVLGRIDGQDEEAAKRVYQEAFAAFEKVVSEAFGSCDAHTNYFEEIERLCPHVQPGDDPCSSCIERHIDPRGVIE